MINHKDVIQCEQCEEYFGVDPDDTETMMCDDCKNGSYELGEGEDE